jgi:hypothetical protein
VSWGFAWRFLLFAQSMPSSGTNCICLSKMHRLGVRVTTIGGYCECPSLAFADLL